MEKTSGCENLGRSNIDTPPIRRRLSYRSMTTARKGDAFTPQVFERLGRAKTPGDAI